MDVKRASSVFGGIPFPRGHLNVLGRGAVIDWTAEYLFIFIFLKLTKF